MIALHVRYSFKKKKVQQLSKHPSQDQTNQGFETIIAYVLVIEMSKGVSLSNSPSVAAKTTKRLVAP